MINDSLIIYEVYSSREQYLYLKEIIKGATQGIGFISVGRDLSLEHSASLYTGSSAAMGMVARKGILGESAT